MSQKRVAYYYDPNIGNYHYGEGHVFKPHRVRMAHSLMLNYGLYKKMATYRPVASTAREMTKFHSDDYISFLRTVTPDNLSKFSKKVLGGFSIDQTGDCPIFVGTYQFSALCAGGSVGGAVRLNHGDADIAINWAGGHHHAKKNEAAGFGYVNDIVLGILELLKVHKRVLYIDIDVHHGDGVEEAFYCTNRVMTVSFHQFGEFFPGTGDIRDIGAGNGLHYALNFPLQQGIDDLTYESIFKPVIQRVMETYRPDAICLQCGADSLTGDRLGGFNLTTRGHAKAVAFVKSFGTPMLVVGGGGYTIRNVARCWVNETAVLLDTELDNKLPADEFIEYYGPDYRLHIEPSNIPNLNTPQSLHTTMEKVFESLRHLDAAPSVAQFFRPADAIEVTETNPKHEAPPDGNAGGEEDEDGDVHMDLSDNLPAPLLLATDPMQPIIKEFHPTPAFFDLNPGL